MSKVLERLLAMHSSPAICGIKASNLISMDYDINVYNEIEELNRKYNPKIYFKILRKMKSKILVLVFKRDVLEKELYKIDKLNFLKALDYDVRSTDSMLETLVSRMNEDVFPHEIGIFLGYDLDDIKSFLDGEKKCIYVGYWKVYSNLEEKINIFSKFRRCTDCVLRLVDKGYSLENFMR